MLGAGRPIPQKKKAAAPLPSFVAQPAAKVVAAPTLRAGITRRVVPVARVYYPPKTGISYPKPGGYSRMTAPMPPNVAIAAPPIEIGPPVPAPPDAGTVLPFRRPRKMIRQRRGGGNQDWADELDTQSAENDTIPYTEQPPVIIAPADPTLPGGPADPNRIGPVTTGPLPDVTDSENAADGNSSDAANAVESGEPYSVIEESEADSNAALPESAPPQSDSGVGDIFADARAWMNSLDPVNRATISASALLEKFNALLHTVTAAVSDFFGKEKLYNNQKAKVGQQLWIADEVVMRLRKMNRPADAQKVLSAAAALQRSSDPVRIDSTNSIIKARVSEFNKLYAGNGVGLGESVSFALAAQLISILTGIMSNIIPGGFAISDYIKRTSEHIVNLSGLMTGMLSRAEYGEIEARSRERFTFTTMFKGVAGVLLIGAAVYIYYKWKKR